MAAKAMQPGVMDLSSQVRAFPLGPGLLVEVAPTEVGPESIAFNIYVML